VLQAALDLVDREGAHALTMRRLGRELGVEAMSLYSHVDGKDDLVDGVVEKVFREMPPIRPGAGSWQQLVRTHARSYRAVLLEHPHAVRLVAGRPLVTEGTASFVDSALGLLRGIGLDVHLADRVLGIVASFTLGHVSEQVGHDERDARPARRSDEARQRSRYPNLAELDRMKPADYDTEFELALDWMINGIEALRSAPRDG
jgi:AcrR family transcriptional regulator